MLAAAASSHFALVVKGVDLRSTGRKSVEVWSWQAAYVEAGNFIYPYARPASPDRGWFLELGVARDR